MISVAGHGSKCLGAIPPAVEPLLCRITESPPEGTISQQLIFIFFNISLTKAFSHKELLETYLCLQ